MVGAISKYFHYQNEIYVYNGFVLLYALYIYTSIYVKIDDSVIYTGKYAFVLYIWVSLNRKTK